MPATLTIVWQRLARNGVPCKRCADTQHELQQAVATIGRALGPMEIETQLEVRDLTEAEFKGNPGESNRLWIAGTPIEQWLNATAGCSTCCSVCGEVPCRTIEVDGTIFETIPERLIVEAALLAASHLLFEWFGPTPAGSGQRPGGPPTRSTVPAPPSRVA
jgi:hypothetical protein